LTLENFPISGGNITAVGHGLAQMRVGFVLGPSGREPGRRLSH
jgi:hypothetical protein